MTVEHTNPIEAFNEWAVSRDWPAHCDPELEFESEALVDLLSIWRAQSGPDPMPHRSKLTARILKAHLGNIAIMERVETSPARYQMRLLGTRLAHALGEMQGKFLDDAIVPEVLPHWHARLDLTLSLLRPLRFVSRVDVRQLHYLRSESFWAPLSNGREPPSVVLMSAILTFNTAMTAEQAAALTERA